jgi:hypothetical protein
MRVRAGEAQFKTYFRCERFSQINGSWHFITREQSFEGPYPSKAVAVNALTRYLEMINSRMFNTREQSTINGLKIVS